MINDGSEADGTKVKPEEQVPVQPPLNLAPAFEDAWLHDFYRECGREATLAYTTLNQMKNWAMVIAAAAISGLSFGSNSSQYPTPIMFAGSVVVYTFILRFFVRAILCYINLVRWNVLQVDCVELKLLPKASHSSIAKPELENKLRKDMQDYYFEWLSPISRRSQLFDNLKLGFYLLFGLSLFFMIWGAVALRHDFFVRGLLTFAVLNTVLEVSDFYRSKFFDNVAASEKRRNSGKNYQIFPVPASRGGFLGVWILNIIVSTVVATWPHLKSILLRMGCN
jgi:hypothetical protein